MCELGNDCRAQNEKSHDGQVMALVGLLLICLLSSQMTVPLDAESDAS